MTLDEHIPYHPLKRNLASKLNRLLELFPVVLIVGVRQCGKTTLSKEVRQDWRYFDLENPNDFDRITTDPVLFFREFPQGLIIDEAQKYPALFETLRGVIDQKRQEKGRFILTGSSSPELLQGASESLAGRVAIIQLHPFKMNELFADDLSPFYQIFNKKLSFKEDIPFLKSLCPKKKRSLPDLKKILFSGGHPEPALSLASDFHSMWMQNYIDTYINRDIRALYPRLDTLRYRRFVSMISRLTGTIVNKSDVARSVETQEKTIRDYIDILNGTFFWRTLESFTNSRLKNVVKMPKGYITDSGISLFLQNILTLEELDVHPGLGRFFECFIIEEIIRGIEPNLPKSPKFYHYRTKAGAEIDLIVEGSFGLLPIEIKYASHTRPKDISSLKHFIETEKLPYGVVINNCEEATLITENIIEIPAIFL